jgi:hypothetical protein
MCDVIAIAPTTHNRRKSLIIILVTLFLAPNRLTQIAFHALW